MRSFCNRISLHSIGDLGGETVSNTDGDICKTSTKPAELSVFVLFSFLGREVQEMGKVHSSI